MIKKFLPIVTLVVFPANMGASILTPLLPVFTRDIGASGIWIGLIIGIYSLSSIIFVPLFGRLSDQRGRKIFLSIGLGTTGIVALAYIGAFALNSVELLVVVRLVHGITSAMILPVARAWVGDIAEHGEEGRSQSYYNLAYTTGRGAGPLVGGFLAAQYGVAAPFITFSILSFLGLLAVSFALKETQVHQDKARKPASFRQIMQSRNLRSLFIFRSTYEFTIGTFVTFMPVLAAVMLGLDTFQISILFTVNLVVAAVLIPVFGYLADKYSRRFLIVIGAFFSFACLALFPLSQTYWQLLCLVVLRSIGSTLALPASSALVVSEGRHYGMGQTVAITTVAIYVGIGIGPIVSGVVVDFINLNTAFYISAAVGTLGTLAFIRLYRSARTTSPYTTSTKSSSN